METVSISTDRNGSGLLGSFHHLHPGMLLIRESWGF